MASEPEASKPTWTPLTPSSTFPFMTERAAIFFDFTDPLSFVLSRELAEIPEATDIRWVPYELLPPPTPLVTRSESPVGDRWARATPLVEELGIELRPPDLVPWTRKAHEAVLLAADHEVDEELRSAIFHAYMVDGRDIGRVDVLVELAKGVGIEHTTTKATLDVDRHTEAVASAREEAHRLGVTSPATLARGEALREGFHNRTALRTFLRS